jgi:type I restriction enzyme, S subunit
LNPTVGIQKGNKYVGVIQTGDMFIGRQRADINVVKEIDVPSPPLSIQRKIAAILSAYDDLIENNTRRIQILEEMAQAIYREWFVHFRFPGHEGVRMVDSGTELGEVPEGWEVVSVSDIATIYRGKSYRSYELLEEGGLPFLNLKCVDRDGGFRQDGLKRFKGVFKEFQTAKAGDIIIALTDMTQERRIIARAARVPDTGEKFFVMSMDLVKVIANHDLNQAYLYGMLRYSSFPEEVKEFANGVNVLHLNPKFIEDYQFLLPSNNLTNAFGTFVELIYKQMDILERKNSNLRITRDVLLPKLVSGELDVSDLDIQGE